MRKLFCDICEEEIKPQRKKGRRTSNYKTIDIYPRRVIHGDIEVCEKCVKKSKLSRRTVVNWLRKAVKS